MAKTISDEVMKLEIVINGNQAQKELQSLEKETRTLTEANKGHLLQKQLLERQGKKDTEQYKLLTATMKQNTAEIKSNKEKMKVLQDQIGLTSLTMAQLQSKSIMLRNTLRNLVPGSTDYIKYEAELKKVTARMNELKGKAQETKMSLGSMADGFNRYQGMALSVVATLTGMVLSVQKIIDINGKLAGAQSNVMKTTGMTRQEVDELTKSFGLLHTRTSRINLLGIAEQGGRIGIKKEEILDFVNVMNKASVALGDSFTGGAEEVANKLGKIKFLFEETKDLGIEQTYNSIGSAINELGANGVASEQNIADFTTRIGSLTDSLKPTIQETLALGAAFEESGIESEVSARAYGIFMNRASTGAADFAKVMGISQKAVEDMINTNPLEFMLQFAEGMKGMDATETAKTLDFLKINADGANKVIGAMGNNTARFRELIDLSNNSFAQGTSLINEYNIKNNDLEAVLERLNKTVSGWFSSETFVKWLTVAVSWLAQFIGAVEDTDGSAQRLKDRFLFLIKVLAIVITSFISYNAAVKLTALWTNGLATATQILTAIQNRGAIASGVLRSAQLLLAAAYYTVTGNTVRATAAMRLFNATAATNPLGLLLVTITSLTVAYFAFRKEVDEASKIQKIWSDINNEANKSISSQKSELELLTKIANNENIAKEKRLKAIERLNEIIPDYIGHLSLENIKTAEGIGILKQYTDELYKNARAKAVQAKFDALAQERVDIEGKSSKEYKSGVGSFMAKITGQGDGYNFKDRKEVENYVLKNFSSQLNATKDKTTGATLVNKNLFNSLVEKLVKDSGLADKEKELALKDAEMKALEGELLTKTVNDLAKTDTVTTKSNFNVPVEGEGKKGGSKKDPNSTQEEIRRKTIEEANKQAEELLALDRQYEDDKLTLMQDGAAKQLLIEKEKYQREIADLEKKKVNAVQLAKLDEEIRKANESGNKTEEQRLTALKKGWDEKNKAYNDRIDKIKTQKLLIHNLNISKIEEDAAKDLLEKEQQAYEQGKLNRETAFNNELAGLNLSEAEKKRRKEAFDLKELEYDKAYLNKKITELNRILSGEVVNGIDFSLLTPEAKEKMKKYIELLQNAVSKIEAAKPNPDSKELDLGIGAGNRDILGFTQDQWDGFFKNIEAGTIGMQTMTMAVMAATEVFANLDKFQTASENARMSRETKSANTEKARLKKKLDSGIISQTDYNKKVEKIDADLDKKKLDIEIKQAKRQKLLTMMSIISNTAAAIMGIWKDVPKFDFGSSAFALSLFVGGLGALQLATVAKQPLPGYEDGLYPEYVKREQDGKTFKSRYAGKTRSGLVSNTSHFLVAENGPEMVIDNKAWTQMDPAVKDALVRDLRGIKGFEEGFYNPNLKRYEVPANSGSAPASSSNGDSELLQMVLVALQQNTEVMKDLRDNGVEGRFYKGDYKSAKNIKESISDYDKLRNNAKK